MKSISASSPGPCNAHFLEQWIPKAWEPVNATLTIHEELLLGVCPAGSQLPVTRCQSAQRIV